jgi:hypothetical protein
MRKEQLFKPYLFSRILKRCIIMSAPRVEGVGRWVHSEKREEKFYLFFIKQIVIFFNRKGLRSLTE